jgi:hypothetical protein
MQDAAAATIVRSSRVVVKVRFLVLIHGAGGGFVVRAFVPGADRSAP